MTFDYYNLKLYETEYKGEMDLNGRHITIFR